MTRHDMHKVELFGLISIRSSPVGVLKGVLSLNIILRLFKCCFLTKASKFNTFEAGAIID